MKIQTEDVLLDVIDVFSPVASEKYSECRKDREQVEGGRPQVKRRIDG